MSNKQSITQLWDLFSNQKWDESKSLFHKEFTAYWPQSDERFIGADNYVGMNREYPGSHRAEIRHLVEYDQLVVCTAFISAADTGQTAFVSSYFEFKEGKIYRATEYWGNQYSAPESRAKWRSANK